MSLFDLLVDSALQGQPGLAPLRPVVEKELLHQDILRELSEAGLLQRLTFIGGTCRHSASTSTSVQYRVIRCNR
jgi:hypothetical protein